MSDKTDRASHLVVPAVEGFGVVDKWQGWFVVALNNVNVPVGVYGPTSLETAQKEAERLDTENVDFENGA